MSYNIRKPLTIEQRNQYTGMSDMVAHLLFHRGITDTVAAKRFIFPDYETGTYDPFLLKDAEKSAIRIIQAIENNERIAIYSDYDADGIPGAAIFNDFFKRIGYKNYSIYIPHRHDEGFGVNVEAVEQLAHEGVKLLVTIDCGITDVEPIKIARSMSIDVIITDHHEPPAELPPAFAIIDHKQTDCAYPEKNLCGSGVAFKLVQAILKKNRFGMKEGMEKWLLDLVGIATMSDMVPLVGENRIFAHYGLAVLRKSPRKGIMQLLRKLGINQRYLTEDDIAFMITPRINAASRMGVPMDAFKLLAADNDVDAHESADHLDKINNERKGVVASLVKEVKKVLSIRYGTKGTSPLPAVIVLGNPDWRPSLLGLVANTCAEEYDRPVFLWGRDGDDIIKGSCRSEGRTNVVELMRAVPTGILGHFGGHKHSGGFSVSNDDIHFIEKHLNDAFEKMKNEGTPDAVAVKTNHNENEIDMELSLDQIDTVLYEALNRLAPFGMGNPKPVFLFRGAVPASIRKFGKASNHMELIFKKTNSIKVPAISFFGAEENWVKSVKVGVPVDVIASVEKSMFRNKAELRLRIIDILCK
jgi:single-stranded-DNA-specific exonuclease